MAYTTSHQLVTYHTQSAVLKGNLQPGSANSCGSSISLHHQQVACLWSTAHWYGTISSTTKQVPIKVHPLDTGPSDHSLANRE